MADLRTQRPLSYKFQRLRETIRRAILSGELSGKVPGERQLARRYQVNAKTVGKALSELTSEGLLVRQIGRGTFVTADLRSSRLSHRPRHYRWVVDAHANHTDHVAVFSLAVARAAADGHRLMLDRLAPLAAGQLPSRWLSPSVLKNVDGVVVFSGLVSGDFVADLTRRRIPVVMTDARSVPIKSNTVRPDYARGAFELTEYLIGLGHRRIALVLPAGPAPATADAVRGWQAALTRYALPAPAVCKCRRHAVADMFSAEEQPSAAIAAGSHVAQDVHNWLAGPKPPQAQKLILAVLLQPGQQLGAAAATASYAFDVRRIVEWSLRLLDEASPGQFPTEVVIPGALTTVDQLPAASPIRLGTPREAVF